ncbi:MAG: trypsin-like peptidase domain-containing protein [bacterium]
MRSLFCRRLTFVCLISWTQASSVEAKMLLSFADVADNAIPGVVNIRTTQYTPNKDPALDLYQFFLNGRPPTNLSTHSVGSGVVINKQGHILTNAHVIEGANVIEVLLAKNRQKLTAKVLGTDLKTDLALLKISGNVGLVPLQLGDSDALRVGDPVIAIGNPFGYSHTVTSGIISAKGRVIGNGPYDNFLQTDASIHPGNSGGPLLDINGRVIGINTAVSEEGVGIGFAIPINIAKQITADLSAYGKTRRPWLGMVGKNILSADEIDSPSAGIFGPYGVIVSNLIVNAPAHRAGVRIGDVVLTADDKKITDLNQFQRLLLSKQLKGRVKVKIYRKNKGYLFATIPLEETPKTSDLPQERDLF